MARAIKQQLAEAAAREEATLALLRKKPLDGKRLFYQEFGLELGIISKKTRAFFEMGALRPWWSPDETKHTLLYAPQLRLIQQNREGWKRPLSTWSPRGKAGQTVLQSLVQHLFCLYPVPLFLVQHWTQTPPEPDRRQARIFDPMEEVGRQILLSVGKGDSFAKMVAKGHYKHSVRGTVFPPLTKRQCHLFLSQPSNQSVMMATRHAQVQSFEGSRLLGNEIAAAWPSIQMDEAFTAHAIQWFCNQGMFDPTKVRPMVDYIRHCRQHNPLWELSGRTVTTLLQGMDVWHQELKQQKITQTQEWERSGILPYNLGPNPTGEPRPWICVELCSTKDLHAEGKAMHHCVGSYSHRASTGHISIWSLRYEGERRLTIEVTSDRTINQARGPCNAKPSRSEREQLHRWAGQAGLKLSTYL